MLFTSLCLVALNTDMHIQSENLSVAFESAYLGLRWSGFKGKSTVISQESHTIIVTLGPVRVSVL